MWFCGSDARAVDAKDKTEGAGDDVLVDKFDHELTVDACVEAASISEKLRISMRCCSRVLEAKCLT